MARSLARGKAPYPDGVCFHCQQAAEKYLKGMLQEKGLPVPRIHDLELLLNFLLAHDVTLAVLLTPLASLNRYAVEYRYPGRTASIRQAKAALRRTTRIRTELRKRLGL
jgi:HEPN domain-containing protein